MDRRSLRYPAVLFDWRLTLFHQEPYDDAYRHAATAIGLALTEDELAARMNAVGRALADPAGRPWAVSRSDASQAAHRAHVLGLFAFAGLDDVYAEALYERESKPEANAPYPDAPGVLKALAERGCRIAIVSDIHFDLRPHFEAYGLGGYIDAYVLSYEHDFEKPEPRAFELALEMLDVPAASALMVGDRAERDGGAAAVGVTTLILPPVPLFATRGLDVVLDIVGG